VNVRVPLGCDAPGDDGANALGLAVVVAGLDAAGGWPVGVGPTEAAGWQAAARRQAASDRTVRDRAFTTAGAYCAARKLTCIRDICPALGHRACVAAVAKIVERRVESPWLARARKEQPMDPRSPEPVSDLPLPFLEPGETIHVLAATAGPRLIVTDRRVAVADENRVALNIAFDRLRRVQFDIERTRPATLVLVPEDPLDEPQVLGIPSERYDEVARALAIIGHNLARTG
jgi:hypothetical protein